MGSITSISAYLNVTGLPNLTITPPKLIVFVTQHAVFRTLANGIGKDNFNYQWKHNGESIDGENTDILHIDRVTESHNGDYECIATNEYGDSGTSTAQLFVQDQDQSMEKHPIQVEEDNNLQIDKYEPYLRKDHYILHFTRFILQKNIDYNYTQLSRTAPKPPEHHISREELLQKIAAHICDVNLIPQEGLISLTLTGAGGFGKTTACLALCEMPRVRETFKNGFVFIELGPKCQDANIILNDHYCRMINEKFENRPMNDVEIKIKILTAIHNKYLVIVDDVWDADIARPIVNAFSKCKIIITTRIPTLKIEAMKVIEIGPMTETEAVELITRGIPNCNTIHQKFLYNLAEVAYNWPLLLSLLRGQLYHCIMHNKMSCHEAIQYVQGKLVEKGIISFDQNTIDTNYLSRQLSIQVCVQASLDMLSESTLHKYISLILMTGVGGYLSKAVLHCLWDVSKEEAAFTVSELKMYGLLVIIEKKIRPNYSTNEMYVRVHTVLSEFCISILDSKMVAYLSPYIFLRTRKIVDEEALFVFQESYGITDIKSLDETKFLAYTQRKLEFVILPHYVNEISMHAIHDPHLVKVILQNVQTILTKQKYGGVLATFNDKITTLIIECDKALQRARILSRKYNQKFQQCFNEANFDGVLSTIGEYCSTEFISSVTFECVETVHEISTYCDDKIRKTTLQKCRQLRNMTPEYHPITLEKLPRLKLHTDLHKSVSKALKENLLMKSIIYDDITSGKIDDQVKSIYENYLIKISEIDPEFASDIVRKFHGPSHLPPNNNYWIGDIETHKFDSTGGIFYSFNHEVTVTVPAGAIPEGKQAELKFAATLLAPVKFTPDVIPVSAIVWLCMDMELKKPIKLCLPHFVNKHHVNNLYFAKMAHSSQSEGLMKIIEGGEFKIGENFGLLEFNHFCYYCTVFKKTRADAIPKNLYRIIPMKHKKPMMDFWKCDVCIIPSLPTCRTCLEKQYDETFICDEECTDFSFAPSSDRVNIVIDESQFSGSAEVKIISGYVLNKKQVNFQHCYEDQTLTKQLQRDLHQKLYPRRFRLEVVNRDPQFFHERRYLRFCLFGGEDILCRDIAIAAVDIPTSDISSSISSRYTSNDYLECIRSNYTALVDGLPTDQLFAQLIQYGVITDDERAYIKLKKLQKDKTMYLLDDVITPSLKAGFNDKYLKLVQVMRKSDNTSAQNLATRLLM